MNVLETNLREAEGRARLAENVLTAASVLNDAGMTGDSPLAHRLFHEMLALPDGQAMRRHLRESTVATRPSSYTPAARKLLAKDRKARPDGSYPINTAKDVQDAVADFNRSSGSPEDKAHIIARAKAVGATDNLPADWQAAHAHIQESAKRLRKLGVPMLDGHDLAEPVRLREATADELAELGRRGIPILAEHAAQGEQALDGIPLL